jgi:hypothetical protein
MKRDVRKFNFSKRLSYTLIAIVFLTLIGVGVYAYGTNSPSTFGHTFSELNAPSGCNVGQYLMRAPTTDGWTCETPSSSSGGITSISSLNPIRVEQSGTGNFVTVTCPSGKTVVGGGCYSNSPGVYQFRDYPSDTALTSWGCQFDNPSNLNVIAYAICVN